MHADRREISHYITLCKVCRRKVWADLKVKLWKPHNCFRPGWKEKQQVSKNRKLQVGSCFQAGSGCLGLKYKWRWRGMRQHGKAERETMVCMNIFADPRLCNSPRIMWPLPFSVCSDALKRACFRWPQASRAAAPHSRACHTSVFSVWQFWSMYSHDYAICNEDVAKKEKRKSMFDIILSMSKLCGCAAKH